MRFVRTITVAILFAACTTENPEFSFDEPSVADVGPQTSSTDGSFQLDGTAASDLIGLPAKLQLLGFLDIRTICVNI